jgi:hypothetical protein
MTMNLCHLRSFTSCTDILTRCEQTNLTSGRWMGDYDDYLCSLEVRLVRHSPEQTRGPYLTLLDCCQL